MAEYLKDHGAKVALGLGAIVVTYVLYTCVVASEEEQPKADEQQEVKEEPTPAENVTVETPQIAEVDQNTEATAVEEKIEVAEPVIIEDVVPEEVAAVQEVEEEVQEKVEVVEEPAAEEVAEEVEHNDKMQKLIIAKLEQAIATTQTELKDAEEAEAKAAEEAEAARVEAEAAAKLAAEKAAAEAAAKEKEDAEAAAKAKEEADAALKAQAEKEALQKKRDDEAAAAKKAKEEALAKAAAAKKAKEEADAKALAAKQEADAKAKRAADEKARLAAEARLAIKVGTLKLTVQRADISVNTDYGGKMDPYVTLQMVDENKKSYWKARTKAHEGGHQHPVWDEKFEINVKDYNHLIKLAVFEKDTFSDDHIGDGTFSAKQFSTPGTTKEFQRCYLKDKESARIYIKGVWTPKE